MPTTPTTSMDAHHADGRPPRRRMHTTSPAPPPRTMDRQRLPRRPRMCHVAPTTRHIVLQCPHTTTTGYPPPTTSSHGAQTLRRQPCTLRDVIPRRTQCRLAGPGHPFPRNGGYSREYSSTLTTRVHHVAHHSPCGAAMMPTTRHDARNHCQRTASPPPSATSRRDDGRLLMRHNDRRRGIGNGLWETRGVLDSEEKTRGAGDLLVPPCGSVIPDDVPSSANTRSTPPGARTHRSALGTVARLPADRRHANAWSMVHNNERTTSHERTVKDGRWRTVDSAATMVHE
ncbi:hypothetical protein BJ912DRAFT_934601 [Pholiota molesta]|nr:hypothetical protein BJ912DRAFT_934601 [Pholiota molesta]